MENLSRNVTISIQDNTTMAAEQKYAQKRKDRSCKFHSMESKSIKKFNSSSSSSGFSSSSWRSNSSSASGSCSGRDSNDQKLIPRIDIIYILRPRLRDPASLSTLRCILLLGAVVERVGRGSSVDRARNSW